jgi:tetratricopeptide (TPR) repeat protein
MRFALAFVALLAGFSTALASAAPPMASQASSASQARELVLAASDLLDQFAGDTRLLAHAKRLLDEAQQLNPRDARQREAMARYHLKVAGWPLHPGDPGLVAAEESIRQALQLDDQYGNGHVLLGYVLAHSGKLDEAAAEYARAHELQADSPWLALDEAELQALQGHADAALALMTKVAYSNAPISVRKYALGELTQYMVSRKQYNEADRLYQEQIALDPQGAWAHGNYANFLRRYKLDTKQSEAQARAALDIMNYGQARQCLGLTLYMKWAELRTSGKTPIVLQKILDEAKSMAPDPGAILYEVARFPRKHPIIDALGALGISVDQLPDSASGGTPLILAVGYNNVDIADQLIAAGASVNRPGLQGFTPLMVAVKRKNPAMASRLLALGADAKLLSDERKTAAQYAAEAHDEGMLKLLAGQPGAK